MNLSNGGLCVFGVRDGHALNADWIISSYLYLAYLHRARLSSHSCSGIRFPTLSAVMMPPLMMEGVTLAMNCPASSKYLLSVSDISSCDMFRVLLMARVPQTFSRDIG